jgi:hypothetical protein
LGDGARAPGKPVVLFSSSVVDGIVGGTSHSATILAYTRKNCAGKVDNVGGSIFMLDK